MVLHMLNFRDLGGLPAGSGAIRPGILYRSEGPANLTAEQQSAMAALGIRNIVDLRSAREQESAPHGWHGDGCNWRTLHVDADLRVFGNEGRERLLASPDPQIAIDTMVETYREIPAALMKHWSAIGDCLAEDELPVLVNCTAGKDRTGVVVALILEMAGVSRDVIVADYMRSHIFAQNILRSGTLEAGFMGSYGFMPSEGQVDALIGVRSEYLEAAFDTIEREWSGVPQYLAEAGLAIPEQQRIAQVLVEEDAAPGRGA